MSGSFIFTEQALTVFFEDETHTVHSDSGAFDRAKEALAKGDFQQAVHLMKPAPLVRNYLATGSQGTAELRGDVVYYKGTPVSDYIAHRAVAMARNGLPIEPLLKFTARLYENISNRVRNELLGFLEKGQMPITPEGKFLAYKRVQENYFDGWSGTIDNSIGNTVEMPRAEVDDNPNNSCSHGLHFASLSYVRHFSGTRMLVLEIDPEDVVSIPVDYACDKGRCCRYKVVGELPLEKLEEIDQQWRERGYVDDFEEGFELDPEENPEWYARKL